MLAPLCPHRILVDCEPDRLDGAALLLECDDEQAHGIIWVLRKKQPQKNLLRVYRRPQGRQRKWRRVVNPLEEQEAEA